MEPRRVTIITEPQGASVTQIHPLGQPSTSLGKTPLNERSVSVVTNIKSMKKMPYYEAQKLLTHVGNVVVKIEKPGYQTFHGTLKTESGHTTVHNITLEAAPQ